MIHKSILLQKDPVLKVVSTAFDLNDVVVLHDAVGRLKEVFSEICEQHNFTSSAGLSLIQIGRVLTEDR